MWGFFTIIQFWCIKSCFGENEFMVFCTFYFLAYFHHDTKSKTGSKIGQKLNFLFFYHKYLTFRKSGKKSQAFWTSEVWSGYGSKMFTWTLNTLQHQKRLSHSVRSYVFWSLLQYTRRLPKGTSFISKFFLLVSWVLEHRAKFIILKLPF